MCGICGYRGNRLISDEQLEAMNDTMYHRGPNDSGIWQEEYQSGAIGFAQRRLSILDLSVSGHQPMFSKDKNIAVIFNGEIYNFREIRESLSKKGYCFVTNCDTEVIIASYEEYGTECFSYFNGMFAIAIWDQRMSKLVLARDRIGKKPLYYYWNEVTGEFVFASELKPIMKYPGFCKNIRREMIGHFLCNKYIAAPFTIFDHTYKMMPGTFLVYQKGSIKINHYWDIVRLKKKNSYQEITNYEDAMEEMELLLLDSVERRLIADVPVGTFLSGGIDSTLVTAMAQHLRKEKISSFSIGFYDKERNEAVYADQIAAYLGTNHHELYVGEAEILDMIDRLPYYYDEPFSDSSQLPTMLVSKLAASQVTVALSGDGGDELFCGYKMYDWTYIAQKADWIGEALHAIPGMDCLKRKFPPELRAFINNRDREMKTQLYVDVMVEVADELLGLGNKNIKYNCERELNFANWQERRMLLDMMTYLPDEILAKTDRASMKYSLEVRCPILDYRVIEKSFQIPHAYKYRNWNKKYLLKQLTYKYVPKEFLDRPKKGFGVPLRKWLRTTLKKEIARYAERHTLVRQGIFVPEAVEKLITVQEKSDKIMYSSMLWSFYVFQTWYQMYVEDFWN